MTNELFNFKKNALQGVLTDPLCAEYRSEWRACGSNKEKLIMLAMRQQAIPFVATYCYQGKGVTKDYFKNEFADYINGCILHDCDDVKGYAYQLFIDPSERVNTSSDVVQMLWCNNTEIEIQETKCPTMYIACSSTVHLTCESHNYVQVYLFDDSKLVVDDADETCKVIVRKYSDKCNVDKGKYCFCEVKEFNKELKL